MRVYTFSRKTSKALAPMRELRKVIAESNGYHTGFVYLCCITDDRAIMNLKARFQRVFNNSKTKVLLRGKLKSPSTSKISKQTVNLSSKEDLGLRLHMKSSLVIIF